MKPWAAPRWLQAAWALAALFAAATIPVKLMQLASLNVQLYDFGENLNIMWNTLHGRPFWSSVMQWNYLSQHFAPLQALFAPAAVYGGPEALLVLQSLILAAGIPAVFLIARRATDNPWPSFGLALLFALSPFLHEAHRVDFHEVTVGITLALWALCAWEHRKKRLFLALTAALFFLREDYGLYMAGFAAAVWLSEKENHPVKPWRLAAAGLAWTGLLVLVVMPSLSPGDWHPAQSSFGVSGAAGLAGALFDPARWFALLGTDRLAAVARLMFFSGGLALFAPRRAAAWLLPLLLNLAAQKEWQYRLDLHYSATTLPFLFWASAHGLVAAQKVLLKRGGPKAVRGAAVGLGGVILFTALCVPRYFYAASPERRRAARAMAARVPDGETAAATANLLPHLMRRNELFLAAPPPRPVRWVFLDMVLAERSGVGQAYRDYVERQRRFVAAEAGGLVLLHFPDVDRP